MAPPPSVVEAAERSIKHWGEIEAACSGELSGAERRIARRQHEVNEAGADFLIASNEFAQFLDRLDEAWRNLRSCVVVGEEIIQAGRGYVSAAVMSQIAALRTAGRTGRL
jgi:hypothetical protein